MCVDCGTFAFAFALLPEPEPMSPDASSRRQTPWPPGRARQSAAAARAWRQHKDRPLFRTNARDRAPRFAVIHSQLDLFLLLALLCDAR